MPSAAAGPLEPSQLAPAGLLSVSSVFAEPVVVTMSGILNTCTSASWAFPIPSSAPHPRRPFASEMQLLGPKGGEPSGQDISLSALPALSQTESEASLCEGFCCLLIMFK